MMISPYPTKKGHSPERWASWSTKSSCFGDLEPRDFPTGSESDHPGGEPKNIIVGTPIWDNPVKLQTMTKFRVVKKWGLISGISWVNHGIFLMWIYIECFMGCKPTITLW
jgi:hypothetical protein